MAGRASDILREKLFGEAKTATDLKDRMWARLYEHTDLVKKVTALNNAKNPVIVFLLMVVISSILCSVHKRLGAVKPRRADPFFSFSVP